MITPRTTLPMYQSIRQISEALYKLPIRYHWVLADSALLQAIASNKPVVRGVQGSRLSGLVNISQHIGLIWPLLWLVSIVELIRLLRRQRKSTQNGVCQGQDYPAHFFVGFGAGPEEHLFKQYCEKHAGKVGRLNQIKVESYAVWHSVSIVSGLRSLLQALSVARMAVAALPIELASRRADFFTYVGMRVGYYAYMRAWFEALKVKANSQLEGIAFLSADTAAFAAVDAGLPTSYLQHGMTRHSTLLPAFIRVEALTADEAAHIRHRLPGSQVTVDSQARFAIVPSQMAKAILIASIYGDHKYFAPIVPFIGWINARKVSVRVRPHPCENSTFWHGYEIDGIVTIEKNDADFFEAISRLRPRLVVSWFSTAMEGALRCGVIPVSICADDDRNVVDMVYPLFRRCVRWPQDEQVIDRLLEDDEYYAMVLTCLREGWNGVSA